MACEQEERYVLIQGNSTTFAGGHFLYDYLATELDLTGYTAKCEVPSACIKKDLTLEKDQEDKWFVTIDFTEEETLKMPLGDTFFYVIIYDTEGQPYSLKKILLKLLRRGS